MVRKFLVHKLCGVSLDVHSLACLLYPATHPPPYWEIIVLVEKPHPTQNFKLSYVFYISFKADIFPSYILQNFLVKGEFCSDCSTYDC